MSRAAFAVGVLVSACAASPPSRQTAPSSTVEVPEANLAPDPKTEGAASAQARADNSDSLFNCLVSLRRADDLQAEPEERSLYDQALVSEERGDFMSARKQYFELISKHPRSRLIPLAYLAFGELFAREAVADPSKWDLAHQAYAEVAKYPPPDNTAYAYSLLRLGDSRREKDDQQALSQYMKSMEAVVQYPALPCGEAVKQKAEEGLVETYQRVGQPDRAWAFFRAKAGEARARVLLADLAARYRKAGKAAEACAAARGAGSDAAAVELARSVCP